MIERLTANHVHDPHHGPRHCPICVGLHAMNPTMPPESTKGLSVIPRTVAVGDLDAVARHDKALRTRKTNTVLSPTVIGVSATTFLASVVLLRHPLLILTAVFGIVSLIAVLAATRNIEDKALAKATYTTPTWLAAAARRTAITTGQVIKESDADTSAFAAAYAHLAAAAADLDESNGVEAWEILSRFKTLNSEASQALTAVRSTRRWVEGTQVPALPTLDAAGKGSLAAADGLLADIQRETQVATEVASELDK